MPSTDHGHAIPRGMIQQIQDLENRGSILYEPKLLLLQVLLQTAVTSAFLSPTLALHKGDGPKTGAEICCQFRPLVISYCLEAAISVLKNK